MVDIFLIYDILFFDDKMLNNYFFEYLILNNGLDYMFEWWFDLFFYDD